MKRADLQKNRSSVSSKQAAAGMPIKELCRKGGFSDATFYMWRAKYGGVDVPDTKRLRELEGERFIRLLRKLMPAWWGSPTKKT